MKTRQFLMMLLSVCVLVSCSSQPTIQEKHEVNLEQYEKLKLKIPTHKDYQVKPLSSLNCDEKICTMSREDLETDYLDKRNLVELFELSNERDSRRVEAHNQLVDVLVIKELSANELRLAVDEYKTLWRSERDRSLVMGVVNIIGIIVGGFVFWKL